MIGAVVLAAGGSRRLGRPKQLVRYQGRSLVRNATEAALGAGYDPVVVVVGAAAPAVKAELGDLAVHHVENPDWSSGIASSIRIGLRAVRNGAPGVEAVLLTTCDQTHLTLQVLCRLREAFDGSAACCVASEYAGSYGTPALFGRSLFDDLEALEGDQGAKRLLLRDTRTLKRVPWPAGVIDVDRPGDEPPAS